jgi:hypothetical protein
MPIYETDKDRTNEHKVMSHVAKLLKSEFGKNEGDFARIDYWLQNPKSGKRYFVEVKCRTTRKDQYPTYFISLDKWRVGKELAKQNNTKFVLFVKFSDGIYYTDETDKGNCGTRFLKVGGRYDRGGVNDIEVMIHIPHGELIQVKEK